jgi:hypothetical protein
MGALNGWCFWRLVTDERRTGEERTELTLTPGGIQSSPRRQDRAAASKLKRRIQVGEAGVTHSES